MSANGVFSTTYDIQFFGGGVLQNSGEVSALIEPSLDFHAKIPVYAQSNNSIDFIFAGGIETPELNATADLSFDFSVSSQADQGIQRFGFVEWKALQIPFSANSEGYSIVAGEFNQTLDFILDVNYTIFSIGEKEGEFGFSVSAKGVNVSTRTYQREGGNYCEIDGVEFNEVSINAQSNDVTILDNGERHAEIITAFNK